MAQWLTNPTRNHEVVGSIPGLTQGVKASIAIGGVDHPCNSDPTMLWLWCRQAATVPIRSLAWEPPCTSGVALEKTKKKLFHSKLKFVFYLKFHLTRHLPCLFVNSGP